MRRGELRFDRSPVTLKHESARGTILRNTDNFTRGSQLISHQFMMFFAGVKIPFLVWLAIFLGVFAFLAARFDYPAILDGSAAEVLPNLLATGATGRAVWAVYGFLPIIWIPAGVEAFHALRPVREGSTRIGMLFAMRIFASPVWNGG